MKNWHGIDGMRDVMEIGWHLCSGRSSTSTLIRKSLADTDTQLNAHLVMALCVGTTGHCSGVANKGRETRMLIGHASSQRSGAELNRLMVVRTCRLGKGAGWNHLRGRTARGPAWGRTDWGRGIHLIDAKPNGQYDRRSHHTGSGDGLTARVGYGQ